MNETEHTNPSKDLHQPIFFFTLKQLDDPVLSGSGIGSSLFKLREHNKTLLQCPLWLWETLKKQLFGKD